MGSEDARGILPGQSHVNLRSEREGFAFCRVLYAHRPAGSLWGLEVHPRVGGGIPAIAVENQIAGGEMDGILEFLRRGLVRRADARRIGLQIDLHSTLRRNISGFRIEGEVLAIDLIEARRVAAVKNDGDIVQFGAAVKLELLNVFGTNRKDRAPGLLTLKIEIRSPSA